MNNEDMIVELAGDSVSSVFQMAQNDDYENLHKWLQLFFIEQYTKLSSKALRDFYKSQMATK